MVPLQRTPHEALQEDLDYLARTVLEGKYKKVRIDKIKIEEDIIERRWLTSNHLAKVLVVPAGKRISRSEAEKLGLI